MKSTILMCAIVLALGFSQNVYVNNNEQVRLAPKMLNYQGYLTDTLGIPVTNASLSMSFAIFDASSAGNQKWTETQTAVNVNKGIFHVLLGSVTPIPDSVFTASINRWLELTVAGQVLAPRTRLTSAGYSYSAIYSDTAQYARNAAADNDWIITGNNQYSGVSGNVGIGTNAPEYKFDVHGILCAGDSNTVASEYGAVLGGRKNRAGEDGDNSVLVVGGNNNTALHSFSAIVGGRDNYSEFGYNFIGGGYRNYVIAEGATVAGGECDTINAAYGSVLGGYSNLAGDANADTAAAVCGGYDNTASGKYSIVGAGRVDTAGGSYSVVTGGYSNIASANYAAVGGGYNNTASQNYSTVGGGNTNVASGSEAVAAGGYYNTASGNQAVVAGGSFNTANAVYGGILSGYSNIAGSLATDTTATVCGGFDNSATAKFSFVGGGSQNTGSGLYSTIVAGKADTAKGDYCGALSGSNNSAGGSSYDIANVICGGVNNIIKGYSIFNTGNSFIGGGAGNSIIASSSTISGGTANHVAALGSIIAGGVGDTVYCRYSSVLSGYHNIVGGGIMDSDTALTICGGYNNYAHGHFSFIGGGYSNDAGFYATVAGGYNNRASSYSVVSGGENNTVSGAHAVVSGGYADTAKADCGGIFTGYDNLAGDSDLDSAAVICGGRNNRVSARYSFIGGGHTNSASGGWSAIGGGSNNTVSDYYATIAGGNSNAVNGPSATVAGGYADTATGWYGFATNNNTKVSSGHDNSAALTTSHTLAANQVRAAAFSTGYLDFAMDHPKDPMNKILNQYAVGSDEVMLMYSGSVVLDANGRAIANLPDYFDDIGRKPRIQLTGVGTYEIYVAEEISGNRFIVGGKPNTKVFWQVTAERKDIHAEIARIQTPVVQEKTGDLRNHSIDDDAMISIYDDIKKKNPELFQFKTDEGRRVHEQSKNPVGN